MTIKVGDLMPSGNFGIMTESGPSLISTNELFDTKRVVLISVPGAFTPVCSDNHLAGYLDKINVIKSRNIDLVACMAVNDVFVLNAWAKELQIGKNLLMLADGNGDYAKALDLELDSTKFGMGVRSQRFSSIIDNGEVKYLAVDNPGQFKVSKVELILDVI
ncbi:MAG: peroxiredoxin [Gammaproteobacteria bacterium]|nr:peroxiredoxin [Gammaproteobacteria bacterium]|tara:strand:- start:470 stop:952 length:483 start_codon:yes stop_codon:yes gene_type:complete